MDNPTRTAAYRALVEQRRTDIRSFLDGRFLPGTELVWEVGCGHGHFLTAYARVHPERQCVGIDISSDRIERAERKLVRASLSNLHFLQAEARLFLQQMPGSLSFSQVFILFPDPWPKLRHQKHRILQADFLSSVARRASPGCRLYFRTDFLPYYTEAATLVRSHSAWQTIDEPWPFEFETVFQQRAAKHYSVVAQSRP